MTTPSPGVAGGGGVVRRVRSGQQQRREAGAVVRRWACVRDVSRTCLGSVSESSRKCLGSVLGVEGSLSRKRRLASIRVLTVVSGHMANTATARAVPPIAASPTH